MIPARPKLIVFDCDGVLVDSEPVANAVLREALAGAGLDLEVTEVRRRYVGLSMATVVRRVEAELGRALPEGWLDALQLETFAALRAEVKPVRNVADAVRAIQAAGLQTCVASSGSIGKMTLTLGVAGLLPLFQPRLYSAAMVERGKPAPDLFEFAARQLSMPPPECAVVEDSAPGVQAAVAAGMRVYGYAGDPETDGEALRAAGAVVFTDMARLPELLGLTKTAGRLARPV